MLIVETATAPSWADADHTAINLTVKFESFDEPLPFCANPDDIEAHGRELYQRAMLGEFGSIAEYVAPPPLPAPPRTTTPLQFIERFTEAEQLAIVTAAMQVPALRLWYDKLMAAQQVVFDDPRLAAGMDALVAAGLLTAERNAEVLGD